MQPLVMVHSPRLWQCSFNVPQKSSALARPDPFLEDSKEAFMVCFPHLFATNQAEVLETEMIVSTRVCVPKRVIGKRHGFQPTAVERIVLELQTPY